MAKTAILAIRIISDAKGAQQGIDKTAGKLDKFKAGTQRAAAGAAVLGAGLLAVGKEAMDNANALQQSTGAVSSVFGKQAGQINKLAANAATAVGLSSNSYNELASVLGAQLGNMGIAEEKLVGTTDDLIKTGADLAATFGGTTSEAVSALSALMRGEADPIERYGVSIKQADINARLASEGLSGLEGAELKQAETAAKLALITEQTAGAHGQFKREVDSAAGSSQIATAEWENATAQLGTALLPVVVKGAQLLSKFSQWVQKNSGTVKGLSVVLGITTVAVLALNLAMSLNPIALVVIAIAGLIAGLVVAYNKVGWFKDMCNAMGAAIKWAFNTAVDWVVKTVIKLDEFLAPIGGISGAMELMGQTADRIFSGIIGWIQSAIGWVADLWGKITGAKNAGSGGGGGMFGLMSTGTSGGSGATIQQEGQTLQPMTFTATSPAPAPSYSTLMSSSSTSSGGTFGGSSGGLTVQPQVNITIEGALDPHAVGKQVDGLLRKYLRTTGTITNGQTQWSS